MPKDFISPKQNTALIILLIFVIVDTNVNISNEEKPKLFQAHVFVTLINVHSVQVVFSAITAKHSLYLLLHFTLRQFQGVVNWI